jgi:ABC-type lipoprotein export system ATPase subunit
MDITFKQIMPIPLKDIQHSAQSIWGSETQLKQGQRIMLNAFSGKGKSTFTHILYGIRKDYTGDLLFNQQSAKELSVDEWIELRKNKIAVVFQDLQLFPNLTVKENLELKNSICNTFSENELKEMLATLGIANKWDDKCGILSMGQQQRVAIIRALCQPFEWIILDEPFSHLDKENSAKCLELIDNRCQQLGAGFVLTTLGDQYGYTFTHELKL